jgi:hypothetical protein
MLTPATTREERTLLVPRSPESPSRQAGQVEPWNGARPSAGSRSRSNGLPVAPGKDTDSRAAAFIAQHGRSVQVEVEALPARTVARAAPRRADLGTTQRYIDLAGVLFRDEAEAAETRMFGIVDAVEPESG